MESKVATTEELLDMAVGGLTNTAQMLEKYHRERKEIFDGLRDQMRVALAKEETFVVDAPLYKLHQLTFAVSTLANEVHEMAQDVKGLLNKIEREGYEFSI